MLFHLIMQEKLQVRHLNAIQTIIVSPPSLPPLSAADTVSAAFFVAAEEGALHLKLSILVRQRDNQRYDCPVPRAPKPEGYYIVMVPLAGRLRRPGPWPGAEAVTTQTVT